MNAAVRLAAFGAGLVAAFGAGACLGATIGPDPASPAPDAPMETDGSPPVTMAKMDHGSS